MIYILPIIGAILFIIGFALLLIVIDAKKKAKIHTYVQYAEDGINKDFESNHSYDLCSAKGFKVVAGKNGKFKIISQSRLIRPSFFSWFFKR